jgi:hypothetical protein
MDFEQAFETAKLMFREAPSFALCKRARGPAKNDADVSALLALVEGQPDRQGFSKGFELWLRRLPLHRLFLFWLP